MSSNRDERKPHDVPPHIAAQIASGAPLVVREDVTGKYDTPEDENAARTRRGLKDAELAAVGVIDLRARAVLIERDIQELRTNDERQEKKIDMILTSALASDKERERRAAHDEAERERKAKAEEAERVRRAAFRHLLVTRIAPILIAIGGIITAIFTGLAMLRGGR